MTVPKMAQLGTGPMGIGNRICHSRAKTLAFCEMALVALILAAQQDVQAFS